ncbi:MAG: hypothetical protein JXQ75_12095 [Phycisphaerae bacterium]|nr:hypothetical protein [Phycisphaerae bacterium]
MFDRNLLLHGDNLELLSDPEQLPSAAVDLVYLHPPFNYNVPFKEPT